MNADRIRQIRERADAATTRWGTDFGATTEKDYAFAVARADIVDLLAERERLVAAVDALQVVRSSLWLERVQRLSVECGPMEPPTVDEIFGYGGTMEEAEEYVADYDHEAHLAEHARLVRFVAALDAADAAVALLARYAASVDGIDTANVTAPAVTVEATDNE